MKALSSYTQQQSQYLPFVERALVQSQCTLYSLGLPPSAREFAPCAGENGSNMYDKVSNMAAPCILSGSLDSFFKNGIIALIYLLESRHTHDAHP